MIRETKYTKREEVVALTVFGILVRFEFFLGDSWVY